MSFCTAIDCMDGRAQLPVIEFLKTRFGADYVDMITEPGPNRLLAAGESIERESIVKRVEISLAKHKSLGIAVAGHHDCAGNPAPEDAQTEQTKAAVGYLKQLFPCVPVIGLWLGEDWRVMEIC